METNDPDSDYAFFGAYLPPYAKRFLDRLETSDIRFQIEADDSSVHDLAPTAFPEPFSAGAVAKINIYIHRDDRSHAEAIQRELFG